MKKITAPLVLFLAVFWAAPAMSAQKVLYGVPRLQSSAQGPVWILEQEGTRAASLGPRSSLEKNQGVMKCLKEAAEMDRMVKFSGSWEHGESLSELNPATAKCSQILKRSDCPQKVLFTVTVDAVNLGVECGDFCYLDLEPEHGQAISMYADEEKIEKLFGPKPGEKVRATYNVEIGWMPESLENPDDENGFCYIYSIFKSGKLLGK